MAKKTRHDLTYEERAVWGLCPICKAPNGQACDKSAAESRYLSRGGAHLARLQWAPQYVYIAADATSFAEIAAQISGGDKEKTHDD